jgi:hypothetical protein
LVVTAAEVGAAHSAVGQRALDHVDVQVAEHAAAGSLWRAWVGASSVGFDFAC